MIENIRKKKIFKKVPPLYMHFLSKTISRSTRSSFLRRVQSGDEKAWHQFYLQYAEMIRNIGQTRKLTPEECDDLLSDVMFIFWKKLDSFLYDRRRGRFRQYLSKITHFAAIKIFNRNHWQFQPETMDIPTEYPEGIDVACMEEWRKFLLNRALEDLEQSVDTEMYQIFYMSAIQERPVKEIAAITRRTPNNIYVIRSRCLKKLRKLINGYRQCEEAELARHSHKNI